MLILMCSNDRKNKAFELLLPDLDKDIDMASDVAKAMFADTADRLSQPSKSNSQKRTTTTSTSSNENDRLSQTVQVKKILEVLRGREMSVSEIAETMGIKHRQSLREHYLRPALQAGVIEYTLPDKPNSRLQKYRIASSM